ncbi:MAG: zinc ribbon domain-containing protein [Calditrichaeota bacterium]|nr:MAG: zinc ribbon domain-containing protein [Calditrichota bacterium]
MPIYEFYCKSCNTVYKFFSKTVNTDKVPGCPRCANTRLQRTVSTFATLSPHGDEDAPDFPDIDEAKVEQAMSMLAREADKIDENDPRQAADLMRKLTRATGLKMGAGMEEALQRLEQGEDPDKIEEEMGDLLAEEEPFLLESKKRSAVETPRPNVDDTIYDL